MTLVVDNLFHTRTFIIFYTISKHNDKLCATWRQLKLPSQYKSVSFNRNHSQTATSTFLFILQTATSQVLIQRPKQTLCLQARSLCKTMQQRTGYVDVTVIVSTYFLGIWRKAWEATDPRNEGSGCGYSWVVANGRIRLKFKPRCEKASMYTGIMFKINVSSLEKWLTFKLSVTSHLIFRSYESVHTIRAAHKILCSIFKRTTPV